MDERVPWEDCPEVSDPKMLERFPRLRVVAGYIAGVEATQRATRGFYREFDEMNVSSIAEYLDLLGRGNERAVRLYNKVARGTEGMKIPQSTFGSLLRKARF